MPTSPPSLPSPPARAPRVVAVLVVTDGERWLPSVLGTLSAQGYAALELVVVDNACEDGSAGLLERHVPRERLLRLPQRVGYGRAVRAALDLPAARGVELVLLLHDDLALAPDALQVLVDAMVDDPQLGVVGPKLRAWDQPVLQEVGMRIDRFGWAENRVEPGELDQEQHDRRRPVLYVSTAGMLLRASLLEELRGFDDRFTLFRDDLELCWRAWQVGARVEVVPAAVGYHVAAASRGLRRLPRRQGAGGTAWQAREYAERHTLATLITCYGRRRLLTVVPAVGLLAVAKVLAFMASRRFGDALAVVRAHLWNLSQLSETLRRRRQVQHQRVRSDVELEHLFANGVPRVRAYTEAARDWWAGSGDPALLEEPVPPPALAPRPGAVGFAQRHPAAVVGLGLLGVYLVGVAPLLGPGQLVGGEVAPWPDSARAFMQGYSSPWLDEPPGSDGFRSPVQVVLALGSLAGLGSSWLAQRLLVLGLMPLAWVLALRAGRLLTSRVVPRVLGATLYALSPVLLGALAQGRWSVLVVAALLPWMVHAAGRAIAPGLGAAGAWRGAAALALGLAVALAAAPALWPVPVTVLLGAAALACGGRRRSPALSRLLVAGTAAGALLAPWLLSAVTAPAVVPSGSPDVAALPLWRALLTVPASLPDLTGAGVMVPAATFAAVAVTGVAVALRLRPAVAVGLLSVLVGSAIAASALARTALPTVPAALAAVPAWPPALLLPGALALGGLGVVAARTLPRRRRRRRLGRARLTAAATVAAVSVGILAGLVRLAGDLPAGLLRDTELVPAFVTADQDQVGPYQVLILAAGADGAVHWEVVSADGPQMTRLGAQPPWATLRFIGEAVEGAVGAADPTAAARLGLAGVRYVVVAPLGSPASPASPAPTSPASPAADTAAAAVAALTSSLDQQAGLEPEASGGPRVYRVAGWLPRVALLAPGDAEAVLEPGGPLQREALAVPLAVADGGQRAAVSLPAGLDEGSTVVVTAPRSQRWSATLNGVRLPRAELDSVALPVNAFALPADAAPGARLEVLADAGLARRAVLLAQALVALAVCSLALRPPARAAVAGPAPRRSRRARNGSHAVPPPPVPVGTAPSSYLGDGAPTGGRP